MLRSTIKICQVATRLSGSRAILSSKYEKIHVHVPSFGHQDSYNMLMNRNVSTGLDVAAHISHHLHEHAALAVIIGDHAVKPYDPVYQGDAPKNVEPQFIDLREELKANCKMQILSHKIHKDAPQEYFDQVNKVSYRS